MNKCQDRLLKQATREGKAGTCVSITSTGRARFARVRWLLKACGQILRIFPDSLLDCLWIASNILPMFAGQALRYCIAGARMDYIGDNVYFGRYVTVTNWRYIRVGSNVSFHEYCYLAGDGTLDIGNNVSVAHCCSIISFEHTYSDQDVPIKYQPLKYSPIEINENVWLGCGVRVLAGARIESRVVVSANSVARGLLESGAIYAGVPARRIKEI